MNPWLKPCLLAASSGALVFLSFPTWNLWPLAWISMVPLLFAVQGRSVRAAFLLGLLAGAVTNIGGFYWIEGMLVRFGQVPRPAAIPIMALLATYQGLQTALSAALARRLQPVTGLGLGVLFAASYTFVEWLLPLTFPWYLANSQHLFLPVIQICELGGVLLLTLLIVAFNGALYELLRRPPAGSGRRWKGALAVGLAVLLTLGYGLIRVHQVRAEQGAAPTWRIGVVQANIGIQKKRRDRVRSLERHREATRRLARHDVDLVVWPETAASYAFPRDPAAPIFHRAARLVAGGLDVPLLTGAVTRARKKDGAGGARFNSALLLDADLQLRGRYDKTHLLIFGEYVPVLGRFPEVLAKLLPAADQYSRGSSMDALPFLGREIGALICYEDILPRFTRELVARASPDVFINVTNDAWFGETAEPYLHLALAVFRSVEHRRHMVRAVNTGVSAFIDATGAVTQEGGLWEPAELVGEVALLRGRTPYAVLGDWPPLLVAGLLLLRIMQRRRRRPQP